MFARDVVLKLANAYLDALRGQMRAGRKLGNCDVIKGARYLLLKNPEKLDPAINGPKRLLQAPGQKPPPSRLYNLKGKPPAVLDKG